MTENIKKEQELFGRYKTVEIQANKKINDTLGVNTRAKIENNTFRIDFEINTKKEADSNSCWFKIYNPPENFKTLLTKGNSVYLEAGYKNKYGNIFKGAIEKVVIEDTELDVIRKVICSTDNNLWFREYVSISHDTGYLSSIIEDITSKFDLTWAIKKLNKDVYYVYGKSYSGDLKSLLASLADDSGCEFYVSNGHCYMYPRKNKAIKIIRIGADNNLKYIKKNDDYLEGEMSLDFEIKEGITVVADYKDQTYEFAVKEVKFSSNDSNHRVWFKGK